MQERHFNRERYFKEQETTTEKYVLPFIKEMVSIDKNSSVLEIGCGEGGNLVPFYKMGCEKIVGIDLSKSKIENANKFFDRLGEHNNVKFICDDIYNIDTNDIGQFDIIMARDVLEHIHGQKKFMDLVKKFLSPNGIFFIAFPPWYNPFGGHQQMCKSNILSKIPYFHILPTSIYKSILKLFGEKDATIESLLEIKETGITIEDFEDILKRTEYNIDKRVLYFINPNYEVKFGLKPRIAWAPFSKIPFFRNFFITTAYYLVSFKK